MNLKDSKQKIDDYFNSKTEEELVQKAKQYGLLVEKAAKIKSIRSQIDWMEEDLEYLKQELKNLMED